MRFLPIVVRELRLAVKRPKTFYLRSLLALIAAFAGLGLIAFSLAAGSSPTRVGRHLFAGLSGVAFLIALLAGPFLTSDCVSEEKREGTLGLLFLTPLRGYDVVLGKGIVALTPGLCGILTIGPILCFSLLLGGITGDEIGRMALALFATLVFSISFSLLASVVSRDGRKVFLFTLIALILLTAWPCKNLIGGTPASTIAFWNSGGILPSPGIGFVAAFAAHYKLGAASYWRSVQWMLLASGFGIVIASLLIPHTWRQRPVKGRFEFLRKSINFDLFIRRLDVTRRTRCLARHPVFWLANRNRLRPAVVWVVLFLTALACAVIYGDYATRTRLNEALILVLYIGHFLLKLWIAWEASRRFCDDRKSGALELLLTTPLGERGIWREWLSGLGRRFALPVFILLSLDAMILAGYLAVIDSRLETWFAGSLLFIANTVMFVFDLHTLKCVGLWHGLTAKNASRACIQTVGLVLLLPTLLWLILVGILGILIGGGLSGAMLGLMICWYLMCLSLNLGFILNAWFNLKDSFRETVSVAGAN